MSITERTSRLSNAAQMNVETGVWLLCKDFLVTAIQDTRLERGHLRVLAAIVLMINKTNAKAWPDRATLASMTGLSVSSVSNIMTELRKWNYLIADREFVEEAGGRKLTVYTFGNVDHDTIRSEITKFALRMQQERSNLSSPPTVNFTAHGELTSPPTVNSFSPPTVKPRQSSPPTVIESSPPTVDSNYSKGTNNKSSTKAVAPTPRPNDDLLAQVGDPPPAVEIKFWDSAVGYKPYGHTKFENVSNRWIIGQVGKDDLELAREFVATEIEQFYLDPKLGPDGKPIRIMGFLTSGIQYRWPAYKSRMIVLRKNNGDKNEAAEDWFRLRAQMMAADDD